MTKIFGSGPVKDLNNLDKRIHGVEKKFDGFLSAVKLATLSMTFLGVAGITAIYAGAIDKVQILIESQVDESVKARSDVLLATIESYAISADQSKSNTTNLVTTAEHVAIDVAESKKEFDAGVATLEAFTAPIYATATAQAHLIGQWDFFTIRALTHYNLYTAQELAEIIKKHVNYEYTIFRLPDNNYIATFGRFASEEEAQDLLDRVSKVASGPFLINVAQICPIRNQESEFIDCDSKINEY
ncbi:MAG: hypothetical protein BA863_00075 [Desulfovibrio sp. S3730MH75]|nr:MAG: hypothetical protein BA863_00075 [Desulfovibrio sp. S3730MH75]